MRDRASLAGYATTSGGNCAVSVNDQRRQTPESARPRPPRNTELGDLRKLRCGESAAPTRLGDETRVCTSPPGLEARLSHYLLPRSQPPNQVLTAPLFSATRCHIQSSSSSLPAPQSALVQPFHFEGCCPWLTPLEPPPCQSYECRVAQ